ncbi:unnamed protein product [Acanthoscelides obtectus]|uniref:Uncharacterized protein n=1 Tax=Acanthoscelides obtectus TaxID=200917 RepID=A0A9P0PEN0_ACAOB|nr:unnamed protein product [Acanthoscelides obtectus]CAK1665206.1 hypothetical protein AOBTE_LOCUS24711 [Acanthoscelides obtectus]
MASAADARLSITGKLGLKPINTHNLMFYYAPIQGVVSYTALSINVMNPSLVLRIFPKRDITNILLFNTLVGSGLYLYNRPHLSSLSTKEKLLYSSFGAVTFSLGSVLIWAIVRSLVPQNVALCSVCGIGSGLAMIKIAKSYTDHVDSLAPKK